MRWPDAQHGYITAWRDSTLFVYRFVADEGVVENAHTEIPPTQLYPNPATNNLTITSSIGAGTIHLYNILGREVMTGMLSADGQATLDVSHLPRGIYDVLLDHYGLQLPVGMVAVQ
jgi:hypothetical protein